MKKKFYITTPIYYVNDVPHIGHAYTTIAADVLARYHKTLGEEVFFLTGTDEHGAKIAQAAAKKNLAPEIFCAATADAFKNAWEALNIKYDRFIRTTEKAHEDTVQNILQKLFDAGLIYKGEYKGLYCTGCEAIKLPADLVDGQCPDHLSKPEEVKEENYFFQLSSFENNLRELIEKDEIMILPASRKNEILGFLKLGLTDVSISRPNQPWGIPLPFDPAQTTYVWIDALINYLTGINFGEKSPVFEKFWPPDIQLLAKDIIKFHTVIWPAMLLALGLPLPKLIFVHGYFTIDGQKMSKTLGNFVDPIGAAKKFGVDTLRYFLVREFAFGADGDYSEKRLAERFEYDLANDWGNLVQRTLVMADKYFVGKVPELKNSASNIENVFAVETWRAYDIAMQNLQFDKALDEVWKLIDFANQKIDEKKPWTLKVEEEELPEVIYELLEIIRHIAFMLLPFMPQTSEEILSRLGVSANVKDLSFRKWGKLSFGNEIKVGAPLFPRKPNL